MSLLLKKHVNFLSKYYIESKEETSSYSLEPKDLMQLLS